MFDEDDGKRALIERAVDGWPRSADPLPAFARRLFAHAAAEDITVHSEADVRRLAELAYAALDRRAARTPRIAIAHPTGSPALDAITVIDVVNDDRPFLVDSVMAELAERGLDVRLVVHPVLMVTRDAEGRRLSVAVDPQAEPVAGARGESLIHIHVERIRTAEETADLTRELERTLADLSLVVDDWRPMLVRVDAAVASLKEVPPPIPVAELAEGIQFLEWLQQNNFTFLGLREYEMVGRGAKSRLEPKNDTGLGLLRDPAVGLLRRGRQPVTMTPELREFLSQRRPLIITKANLKSRVHRRVHIDTVGVKLFDAKGVLTGELRIAGLFTSTAYTRSVRQIPLLRRKAEGVLARAGFSRRATPARCWSTSSNSIRATSCSRSTTISCSTSPCASSSWRSARASACCRGPIASAASSPCSCTCRASATRRACASRSARCWRAAPAAASRSGRRLRPTARSRAFTSSSAAATAISSCRIAPRSKPPSPTSSAPGTTRSAARSPRSTRRSRPAPSSGAGSARSRRPIRTWSRPTPPPGATCRSCRGCPRPARSRSTSTAPPITRRTRSR